MENWTYRNTYMCHEGADEERMSMPKKVQLWSITKTETKQEMKTSGEDGTAERKMLEWVEGEASGGITFTDMTATMRVTREATNALYSDPHLPQLAHNPSELTQLAHNPSELTQPAHNPSELAQPAHNPSELTQPAHNPSELTQYLSRTAVNPSEAQGGSPTAILPFTPSPSSNSDGSHCAYSSPHYSPQHQAQAFFYGAYSQGQNPQQNYMASSPTYSHVSEHSPPTYNHQLPNQSAPTYHHVPSQVTPTYSQVFGQTTSTYNQQQDQVTPTYSQPPDNPTSIPCHHTSHTLPVTTPLSTPTHNLPYPEDSKVRNGKMYTTYLNNHGGVVAKYERPTRHPSGPTPSPVGNGRVQAPGHYPEHGKYPLPPQVPFTNFFPGFEGVIVPYQLPPGHQGTQAVPGFGSFAYPNNYGGPSSIPSPQVATQFPTSYPTAGIGPHPSKGLGGARRKTSYNNNNNKGERNRESTNKSPLGSSTKEKERNARKAARKLSRGVIKRKRGCTCYRCQIVFASSGHLKRHLEAHGSNRRFKCGHPYCDVAYSRQDNLKSHVAKAIHRRDGDPYVIPVSDAEDTDSEEEFDFGNDNCIIGINNFGDFEPNDEV